MVGIAKERVCCNCSDSSHVSVYTLRGLSVKRGLLRGSAGRGNIVSKNVMDVLCVIYGYVM